MKNFINEKILVTSHTGFKGSWLPKILNLGGAKVIGLSIRIEEDNLSLNHFDFDWKIL